MDAPRSTRPTFYFDLGSPFAYLAAERLGGPVPPPAERADPAPAERAAPAPAERADRQPVFDWQPISLGALFKANGRSSWALGGPDARASGMAEVERRARSYGLAPLRWPDPWPSNYLFAMRAATFAFGMGRGREFVLHAFRDAFQRGRDLGVPEHVLRVAAEVGLDSDEVAAATRDPEIKLALRAATDLARERGVFGVPTFAVGEELVWGEDRLTAALVTLPA
jgi:2-hydroxychromene-2-carboxylate isomerase